MAAKKPRFAVGDVVWYKRSSDNMTVIEVLATKSGVAYVVEWRTFKIKGTGFPGTMLSYAPQLVPRIYFQDDLIPPNPWTPEKEAAKLKKLGVTARKFPEDVKLERDTGGIKCECGGYAKRVKATDGEGKAYGCGREAWGNECCVRAFVCEVCKARYAGCAPAPEMG